MKYKLLYQNKEVRLKKVISVNPVAKYAKGLTKNKKDCVLNITGPTGEGKSVLAAQIAKKYDKRFEYDRNLIYSRRELKEKIETFPPSAFIIDEAINVLYKREWNKSSQKDLIKLLNICRSKGHLLIFVQPAFTDMDKDIRRERVRLWIYAKKRGIGIVFRPIRTIAGEEDPFKLKEMNKWIKKAQNKMGEFIGTLEGAYRTENFLNFIRWDNLDKDEYEVYEKVKDKKKYNDEQEELWTRKDAEKYAREQAFLLLAYLKHKNKFKKGLYKYIAHFFNLTISSVSSYMKKAKITQNLNNEGTNKDYKNKSVKI